MGILDFHNLFLVVVVVLLPSAAPDIHSDRAALVALRSALGGRISFWNVSSATPCSWAGVICSADNSSVVELRLPGMGLSGRLPPNTISKLTNLQTLSIRYNSLSGPLPPDLFSSLGVLRNLYMQHNSFTGQLPESLFSAASLVRVNLGGNNFSGPIPPSFNKLTRLATMSLQDNRFSGPLPGLNLPDLVQFNVSNNNLTGRIPRGLSGLPESSFAGNSLCGPPLGPCHDEKPPKKKLSGGAIAGIVIASIVGCFLILLLSLIFCRMVGGAEGKEDVEKAAEVGCGFGSSFAAAVGLKCREKGLVFFGKSGWKFDLDDLLRASAEVLGKGTFGTAYKAVLGTGFAVAVKRLIEVNMGEKELRRKMEEIGEIEHPNLVPLRAYYYNREENLLVFEYFPMGSLSALLHGNKGGGRAPLNWETRAAIALGAARGVSYIHSRSPSASHGNIKSSNVLLTSSYEARVSDFSLAQLAGPCATPSRVLGYRAPEVVDPQKVSQKGDVYSFGVLLMELLTGKAPSHSLANEEGVDLPRWVLSVVREEWTAELFDEELHGDRNVEEDMVQMLQLAVDCTDPYPQKRPSMEEVCSKIEALCSKHLEEITNAANDDIVGVAQE